MRKVPEILLLYVLRRYPPPTRLSWFNFLSRYAWLKDILTEIYPALFPQKQEPLVPEAIVSTAVVDSRVLGILDEAEIQGRQGCYKAETYLGARGNGHLFAGTEIISKRPVTIKEYLLPASEFTKTEAYQRQNSFQQLGGVHLADGRSQDFRLLQPLEAIADTSSHERCFLITDIQDQAPTLGQYLQQHSLRSLLQVQDILGQILQTLDFLHSQKFMLSAGSSQTGAVQNGLVHGNLGLESLLWIEQQDQCFVYLCDLRLWEQWFDPKQERRSTQVTRETLQQDLQAVAEIGTALLATIAEAPPKFQQSRLEQWLEDLRTARFGSAEIARKELLKLASLAPEAITVPEAEKSKPTAAKNRWLMLLLISLAGFVAAAFLLLPRLRRTEARSPQPTPTLATCCLGEISAIPTEGEYVYTAVQGGSWSSLLGQQNLSPQGGTFENTLAIAHPNLQLYYEPTPSIEEALALVRSGEVDFAILPLLQELPGDLLAQEIAYDGLAIVVSFSYAERELGLPKALNGKIKLEQVQQLYGSPIDQWRQIGGPRLVLKRYISDNPEVITLFDQRILNSAPPDPSLEGSLLPSLDLLRQIIRDFEVSEVGGVGLTTVSELWGQCSVYPLAISAAGQPPVQPMILSNGETITPETNLCTRKGAYGPNPRVFQTGEYPLSYPIVVVYPRDNRRSLMGRKFVELMRTIEGQKLVQASGLVPLAQRLPDRSQSPKPSP